MNEKKSFPRSSRPGVESSSLYDNTVGAVFPQPAEFFLLMSLPSPFAEFLYLTLLQVFLARVRVPCVYAYQPITAMIAHFHVLFAVSQACVTFLLPLLVFGHGLP